MGGAADSAVVVADAGKVFLDGAVTAFRNLSLMVARQEIVCIVGPSGCGKTTFCVASPDLPISATAKFWSACASP